MGAENIRRAHPQIELLNCFFLARRSLVIFQSRNVRGYVFGCRQFEMDIETLWGY
jgi:hypothetical protein